MKRLIGSIFKNSKYGVYDFTLTKTCEGFTRNRFSRWSHCNAERNSKIVNKNICMLSGVGFNYMESALWQISFKSSNSATPNWCMSWHGQIFRITDQRRPVDSPPEGSVKRSFPCCQSENKRWMNLLVISHVITPMCYKCNVIESRVHHTILMG